MQVRSVDDGIETVDIVMTLSVVSDWSEQQAVVGVQSSFLSCVPSLHEIFIAKEGGTLTLVTDLPDHVRGGFIVYSNSRVQHLCRLGYQQAVSIALRHPKASRMFLFSLVHSLGVDCQCCFVKLSNLI